MTIASKLLVLLCVYIDYIVNTSSVNGWKLWLLLSTNDLNPCPSVTDCSFFVSKPRRLFLVGLCVHMERKFEGTWELPLVDVKDSGKSPSIMALWTTSPMWHLVRGGRTSWNSMMLSTQILFNSNWSATRFSTSLVSEDTEGVIPPWIHNTAPSSARGSLCRCGRPLLHRSIVSEFSNTSSFTAPKVSVQT